MSHWRSEIKMWRDDLEAWKNEQAKLFSDVEIALGANAAGLKDHVSSICQHEKHVIHHEHSIAESEPSANPPMRHVAPIFVDNHQKEARAHAAIREAHERIKRHHHRAMAKLAVVLQVLRSGV